MAMSYHVAFQCIGEGREILRYVDRTPMVGEFVSFLNPGGDPKWVTYEVKRVNTFFDGIEPRYVIEIQKER